MSAMLYSTIARCWFKLRGYHHLVYTPTHTNTHACTLLLTWAGFKQWQAQDYSGLHPLTPPTPHTHHPQPSPPTHTDHPAPPSSNPEHHSIERDSVDERIQLHPSSPMPLPPPPLSFPFQIPKFLSMKNESLFFGILCNRRTHFAHPLPTSLGRKWVVGADSFHTEISLIVWLRVTSTPQWQQLLINPTIHHPALAIGGLSPKLFHLNFPCAFQPCGVRKWCSFTCRMTLSLSYPS